MITKDVDCGHRTHRHVATALIAMQLQHPSPCGYSTHRHAATASIAMWPPHPSPYGYCTHRHVGVSYSILRCIIPLPCFYYYYYYWTLIQPALLVCCIHNNCHIYALKIGLFCDVVYVLNSTSKLIKKIHGCVCFIYNVCTRVLNVQNCDCWCHWSTGFHHCYMFLLVYWYPSMLHLIGLLVSPLSHDMSLCVFQNALLQSDTINDSISDIVTQRLSPIVSHPITSLLIINGNILTIE